MRTSAPHGKKTLREQLLAAAMTRRALHHRTVRFSAASAAALARLHLPPLRFHRVGERAFLEGQGEIVAEIVALGRGGPAAALPALSAKHVAETEYLAEQVPQIHG